MENDGYKAIMIILTGFGVLGTIILLAILLAIFNDITGHKITFNKYEQAAVANDYDYERVNPDLPIEWVYQKDFELTDTCDVNKYARMYTYASEYINYTCESSDQEVTLQYNLDSGSIYLKGENSFDGSTIELITKEDKQEMQLFNEEFKADADSVTEQL